MNDRVLEIFWAAADLPRDQRSTFVEEQCGREPALMQRVSELLRALEEAEGESPESGAALLTWLRQTTSDESSRREDSRDTR